MLQSHAELADTLLEAKPCPLHRVQSASLADSSMQVGWGGQGVNGPVLFHSPIIKSTNRAHLINFPYLSHRCL